MTPEERAIMAKAEAIADIGLGAAEQDRTGDCTGVGARSILVTNIYMAIRAAELAAVERCAKVVESAVTCGHRGGFCECYGYESLDRIAATIRSGTVAGDGQ